MSQAMKSLDSLRAGLKRFSLAPLQGGYEPPVRLRQYVEKRKAKFDSPDGARPNAERTTAALRRLLASGQILNFRDLRHICYGMGNEVGPAKQRVISNPAAAAALFKRLEAVVGKRNELQSCYKGMLSTYFAIDGRNAPDDVKQHWMQVRVFLHENLRKIGSSKFVPKWAVVLADNDNLFGDAPCTRYAEQILAGNRSEFEELTRALGVLDQSWLFREAALAAIEQATQMRDGEFQRVIPLLLDLIKQHPTIRDAGVGQVLRRYADIPGQPEHAELLRLSVSIWHNPLFKKNWKNWHPAGDKARGMISQWLKSTLIDDFFQHLVTDRDTDRRRPRFWKRYVDSIDNMFFALGSKARFSQNPDVVRLRSMMGDAKLNLEGGSSSNNGFFMVMKDRVIAEFGEKGYAVYFFHRDNLPFELEGSISVLGRSEWRELPKVHHLNHSDNVHGFATWEERFKSDLQSKFRILPDSAAPIPRPAPPLQQSTAYRVQEPAAAIDATPDPSKVRALCNRFGASFFDDKGARMWIVRASATNVALSNELRELFFSYNNQKACWERSY